MEKSQYARELAPEIKLIQAGIEALVNFNGELNRSVSADVTFSALENTKKALEEVKKIEASIKASQKVLKERMKVRYKNAING